MTMSSENRLPQQLGQYPTPLHIYYENRLLADAEAVAVGLQSQLPEAEFFYSVKTNSLVPLLQALVAKEWKFEVVSGSDVKNALIAGAKGGSLLLAGAAWTKSFLEAALHQHKIARFTVDSLEMAKLLGQCLKERPARVDISLRLHDGASHFGLPARAEILDAALKSIPTTCINTIGLHLHKNPASSSDAAALESDFRARAKILIAAEKQLGRASFFNFGGGFDSPWNYRVPPAEMGAFHDPSRCNAIRDLQRFPRFSVREAMERVSAAVASELRQAGLSKIKACFEPGRIVCGRALSTLLEVKAVKSDLYPDGDIVITDGNTALLGPLHRAVHPLCFPEKNEAPQKPAFVYGNLPHSGDWLFQNIRMPAMKSGERFVVEHTGAYFLPLEANFGLARPGIYDSVTGSVVRAPETDLDPGLRDIF